MKCPHAHQQKQRLISSCWPPIKHATHGGSELTRSSPDVSTVLDTGDPLFSPDPQTRWEASKSWSASQGWNKARLNRIRLDIQSIQSQQIDESDIDPLTGLPKRFHEHVREWGKHFALSGSLNSWMVFVGPGPGNSPTESKGLHALLDGALHHRNPVLGRPHPSLYYPDGQGFFHVVREWVNGAYQSCGYFKRTTDEFAALSSFMVINLTKEPQGNAKKVNRRDMERGAFRFWRDVAPVVRPRFILALTRTDPSVFDVLYEAAEGLGLESELLPNDRFHGDQDYWLPKAVIRFEGWLPVLMTTVPTHPSRITEWIQCGRIRSQSDVIEHLGSRVRETLNQT